MKAWRSPEHVFLFPESSINTNPFLRRAGGGSGTPAPLPPFLTVLLNALGRVPRADEYSRPGPNWEQLAVVSVNLRLFAVAPGAKRCLSADTSIPIRSRGHGQGRSLRMMQLSVKDALGRSPA